MMGFNALRFSHAGDAVFYTSPEWEANPVPTRSGHPILFPFPNRLRAGRLHFQGVDYQLPLNDSSGPNAIHGFTPRNIWRVIDTSTTESTASITGEFCLSKDLPAASGFWPADARIRVTYWLGDGELTVSADIDAADGRPMPLGLGYHPYFVMPGELASWKLWAAGSKVWPAVQNLPTGPMVAVPDGIDFRTARPIADAMLDTVYGALERRPSETVAILESGSRSITICADESFRELLLFVPPHRQAVAIEPYTCATDAAHLQTQGLDSGWRILGPGESYRSSVKYHVDLGINRHA
jgi:aldose 1-epimerase